MPFLNFTMDFCPGHNYQNMEASNLKPHSQITIRRSALTRTVTLFHLLYLHKQRSGGGL